MSFPGSEFFNCFLKTRISFRIAAISFFSTLFSFSNLLICESKTAHFEFNASFKDYKINHRLFFWLPLIEIFVFEYRLR